MTARDNAALTHFELPGIDYREGKIVFIDDGPANFPTGHALAESARVFDRKLNDGLGIH